MIYLSAYSLNNLSFRKVESSSHIIGRIVELVLTHTYSSTSKQRFLVPYMIITRYSRTVSKLVRTPPRCEETWFRRKMSHENYVKNCPKETVAVGVVAQDLATQTTLHHTTGFLPNYQLDATIDNSSYSVFKRNSKQVPQIGVEGDVQQWSLLPRLETELKSAPPILQQLEPEQLQQLLSLLQQQQPSIKMEVSQ
jgi:hypothetical protein